MKSVHALVDAELDSVENAPIYLYELTLDSGVLYFSDDNADTILQAQTYTALPIRFETISQSSGGQIDSVRIEVDNIAQVLGAYAANEKFRGRLLRIKRVFRNVLASSTYYEDIFYGHMKEPVIDYYTISLEAMAIKPLHIKQPLENYSRTCRYRFGETRCGKDITEAPLRVTGTADSGSSTTLTHASLTQSDDFFNYGTLTCTKGGITETREIVDFDAASDTITVSIAFTFAIDDTTTYIAVAGCAKTWQDCYARHTNLLNYGGFVHVEN